MFAFKSGFLMHLANKHPQQISKFFEGDIKEQYLESKVQLLFHQPDQEDDQIVKKIKLSNIDLSEVGKDHVPLPQAPGDFTKYILKNASKGPTKPIKYKTLAKQASIDETSIGAPSRTTSEIAKTESTKTEQPTSYKGVFKVDEKFKAVHTSNGRSQTIGYFSTGQEAAKMYDEYVIKKTEGPLGRDLLNFNYTSDDLYLIREKDKKGTGGQIKDDPKSYYTSLSGNLPGSGTKAPRSFNFGNRNDSTSSTSSFQGGIRRNNP